MPQVFFLTDPQRQNDVLNTLRSLPKGWGVIFRHYADTDRDNLAYAIAKICRRQGLVLLVAGDHRLAAKVDADGLHLPEGLARNGCLASRLNWIKTSGKILTISAHSPAALARADALGADGILLSPIFPTESHPRAKTLGPLRATQWGAACKGRVFALGGMRPVTKKRLQGSSITGIAIAGGVSLFLKGGHRLCWGPQTKGTP